MLNVLFQKHAFVVAEDFVSEQGVVRRREAAAGDGGNHLHLIQQAFVLAFPDDVGPRQFLQHAIG